MSNPVTVTREGDRFVARFKFDFATKDIVKAAGFKFDGANKVWFTTDPEIAAKLADGDVAAFVARVNAERNDAIAASRAATSDAVIPIAKGYEYLPYQRAGIAYAMGRKDTLIADEMGLGKTVQALGIINADPSINNVIIICPASLKLNWAREARRFLARPMDITVVNNGVFPSHGIAIINYEMVGKHRRAIDSVTWDLLISDEAHYLKNSKAQRTANVLGQWHKDADKRIAPINARRRVFLSGTPVLNRPAELWTLAHALDPQGLGKNWKTFVTRYCDGHQTRYGWDVTGASNLDELQGKLRSTIMVRRMKADVLTELPTKRRQVIVLQATTAAEKAAVARDAALAAKSEGAINALRAQVEALSVDEASDEYKAAAQALRKAQQVAFEETSAVRHEVALAKVPQVIEHLVDALEAESKVVVMAHHHDVVDAIAEGLKAYGVVTLTGRDSLTKRDAAVKAFQNDAAIRVFVGSIQAAGVGLTLTAASHVVFAELDWTPGQLAQAEDRCHRIGQTDSVLVQHLVLDGTLDARMAEMLVAKMDVIAKVVDNGEKVEQLVAPIAKPAQPARKSEQVEDDLSSEQIAAIHIALRTLAGMCDGAYHLDGMGFNKMDAQFGHDLASRDTLSQPQAKAARRMVIKYQRQLSPELVAVIKGNAK